ncbi:MAG: hypothetical protein U1F87_16935 [Kiritimatiellia bacterium]
MPVPPDSRALRDIVATFAIPGDFVDATPYGSGHINDTFRAVFNQGGTPVRYLVQRLNPRIFKNPAGLMDNVARICAHARLAPARGGRPGRLAPGPHPDPVPRRGRIPDR